jgi:rod shape-determining protein MreC
MFSKKMVIVVGVIVLAAVNIIFLSVASRQDDPAYGIGGTGISIVAPFQEAFTRIIGSAATAWEHYFSLVSTAQENDELRRQLSQVLAQNARNKEIELANIRLRRLLAFKQSVNREVISAEVIGKNPSPWFRAVIIDKGRKDGVAVGFPVVVPKGIVGQVTEVSAYYAKVLLLIDQNNAVDGLVQRTRARGIVRGASADQCVFKYVLRKDDIQVGDTIISSGLDGVYPKGLRIGRVAGVIKRNSGIFQDVVVTPFADFEKIEEVLVVLNTPGEETGHEK